jgi:formamidopyrimidine-DNA glycosylase
MPEIAEVEFALRHLRQWSCGKTIARIAMADTKRFEGEASTLKGERIERWKRHGKMLSAEFASSRGLLSHLGMTGKWVRNPAPERGHKRIELHLDDGSSIALIDTRRFGWTAVGPAEALMGHPRWKNLGPDCHDSPWTGARLAEVCLPSKQRVKDRMMNQHVIAGLGNIALVEIGFRARVHPHRLAGSLKIKEWERIAAAMAEHIAYALGAEDGDEIRYLGESKSTNPFLCYGRAGDGCNHCGTPILRVVWQGRPTFYCPTCQRP